MDNKQMAIGEFEKWVQRYLLTINQLASFLRSKIDADKEGLSKKGLPTSAGLAQDVEARIAQFTTEITELYTDYVVIRRKYSRVLQPVALAQARDIALAKLRSKIAISAKNISLAVTEFMGHPEYPSLSEGAKAELELLSEWTVEKQLEEFKDVFDAEVKASADEENEEVCGNCGWSGPASECLDDIFEEGQGHIYCPNCELSI